MTGTATTRDLAPAKPRKHVHHGMTPAAWTGSIFTFIGFVIGCVGVVLINYPLMIVGGAVLVLAVVAVLVLRAAGLGAD